MRLKLITVYLLILASLALVGYISFHGLSMLMETMRSALQPDEREEKFDNILDLTLEAENNIRMFTITQDPQFLKPYYRSVENLQEYINDLYIESRNDAFLAASLDSIYNLIRDKVSFQEQLIRLKKKDFFPDYFSEVLSDLDSLETRINKPDTIQIVQRPDTLSKSGENAGEPEEEKKKRGFFARLFSSKKEEETKLTESLDSLAEDFTEPDTLTEIFDKSVELSRPIEQRIRQIKEREDYLQQQITASELNLTRQDDAITLQLASVLDQVGTYLDERSMEKADTAKDFLKNTTRYITLTGTVASMLLLFLIFIVMKDFQLIVRTKKKLEIAKNNAERLASVKEEFLANMSHEIRTPLNAILGFTKQISKKKLPDPEQKYLDIIKHSSAHLLNIINEILDYSKLEAGKMTLEKVTVDVSALIRQLADSFEQEAQEKDLGIRLNIDEKLDEVSVYADPQRLRQILINLVSNAVKFTPKGYIDITASLSEDEILTLAVSDTGIGIDQDGINLIFEKFNQADKSTSRKYGGTGLGLSIVRKLVELHEGQLQVNSEPGTGTSFIIQIPVEIRNENEPEVHGSTGNRVDLKRAKILIADDDSYNLMLLEKMLKDHNALVYSVSSGKEVINLAERMEFDLILLDIQMPEMDGYQVAEKLRMTMKSAVPLYAITAHVNEKVSMKSKNAGIDKVFGKPIEDNRLLLALRNAIFTEEEIMATGETTEGKKHVGVNLSQLSGLAENDPGFVARMTGMYIKNLEDALQRIRKSKKSNNFELIQYTAHKLIPSTRHMGFNRTVLFLKSLEKMEGENLSGDEVKKITGDFLNHVEKILEEVKTKYDQLVEKRI